MCQLSQWVRCHICWLQVSHEWLQRTTKGVPLSLEPPQNTAGKIIETSVYLAVRNAAVHVDQRPGAPSQLAFVRLYCTPSSHVRWQLSVWPLPTIIDYTTKPTIIFKIAVHNKKGYDPTTQVRWLQVFAGKYIKYWFWGS